MPQLITYDGRPVKRRRNVSRGLLLFFYAERPGEPGPQLIVTDDQWRRYGRIQHVTPDERHKARVAT